MGSENESHAVLFHFVVVNADASVFILFLFLDPHRRSVVALLLLTIDGKTEIFS